MEAPKCPLCLEDLDVTERNFHPCKCGYQVCLWCWHQINEKLKGKCPACRTDYDPQGFQFVAPDQESLQKEKQTKEREKTRIPTGTVTTALGLALRKDDVRVLQRNLCYVTGVPASLAKEEVLKKKEYFGKFGRIVKVAVSRKPIAAGPGSGCSAYVTYKRTQDAEQAIKAFNGLLLAEGPKPMKASFGTTKYCASFLRNTTCTKPNCLYLHETARPEDCFSREDLARVTSAGLVDGSPHLTFSPASESSLSSSPVISGGFSLPGPASMVEADSGKWDESTAATDIPEESEDKGLRSDRDRDLPPVDGSVSLVLPPAVHYNEQRQQPPEKPADQPPLDPLVVAASSPLDPQQQQQQQQQQNIQKQLKRPQLQQLQQQGQPHRPYHTLPPEDPQRIEDRELNGLSRGRMSEAILQMNFWNCTKWDYRNFIQPESYEAGEDRTLFSIGLDVVDPSNRISRYEFANEPTEFSLFALDEPGRLDPGRRSREQLTTQHPNTTHT